MSEEELKQQTQETYKELGMMIGVEAIEFLDLWQRYVHDIDDVIDEPKDKEKICRTFVQAALIYSHPVFIRYKDSLLPVVLNLSNTYMDSVIWEESEVKWKSRDARCLCHAGYDMMFTLVWLIAGFDALRKISDRLRTWAHFKHLNDIKE